MPAAIAVALIGGWLLVQTVAGRLPARLLSYRAGTLGTVPGDGTIGVGAVMRGTRVDTRSAGLSWPVPGSVSQEFHPGHDGIDIANQTGTPVGAAGSGRVVFAQLGDNGGYGNRVIIDHGGAIQTTYNHLSRIDVRPGQAVPKGGQIGLLGSTGNSTGPHLHFEVLSAGTPVNPRSLIGGNP